MTGEDHERFWQWLSAELAEEAYQHGSSDGRLPYKPVCLSEVEAVGLLVLAYDAQQQAPADGVVADASRRLADTLRSHLDHLGTNHNSSGT